jgi:hypothetical protein
VHVSAKKVAGCLGGTTIKSASGHLVLVATASGAVLVGLFGYSVGVERAFHLKLKVQLALCQLMTEANSRRGGSTVSGGHGRTLVDTVALLLWAP